MKKYLLFGLVIVGLCWFTPSRATHALGLKVAPLMYEETLADGEKKKGFIDISNPDDQTVLVKTEVQAFKQINNNGDLEFYDKAEYQQGIKVDFTEFTLKSKEALRLYFVLDSDALPKGGVYATLLFKTTQGGTNPDNTSIQPATRVGTHLLIENKGGGEKNASIKSVKLPFFQFSEQLQAGAEVSNVGGPKALAYFPNLEFKVEPFGTTIKKRSSLLFPGISRSTQTTLPGNYAGLYKVTISTGDSQRSAWVIAITGFWRWLAPIILVSVLVIITLVIKYKSVFRNILKKPIAKQK